MLALTTAATAGTTVDKAADTPIFTVPAITRDRANDAVEGDKLTPADKTPIGEVLEEEKFVWMRSLCGYHPMSGSAIDIERSDNLRNSASHNC